MKDKKEFQNQQESLEETSNGHEHSQKDKFDWIKKFINWLRPIEFLVVVIGFVIAVITFYQEADDRSMQRLIAGWQLLSEAAPGSSGKHQALLFLHENKEPLVAVNLSFVRHGAPVYLQSIDLFDENTGRGVYLPLSSFAGAILQSADLRNSSFFHSCLYKTELGNAKLTGSDFTKADLTSANLWKADMTDVKLVDTNLSGAAMKEAKQITQKQLDQAYYCDPFGPPTLDDELNPPPKRELCTPAQGCDWSRVNTTSR